MRPGRLKGIFLWATALGYMGLILWMGSRSDPIPGLNLAGGLDKVAHAGAYGVLAFFLAGALTHSWSGRGPVKMAALAALIATLCGALDEVHQSFVAARDGSIGDFFADAFGALLAAAVFVTLYRMVPRRPEASRGPEADPIGPG